MISNAMAASVSGVAAQGLSFLHISNNIANSSTVGYKSTDVTFVETLSTASKNALNGDYSQQNGGVNSVKTRYDFSSGQFKDNSNDYNIAIKGDGFFPVTLGGVDFVTRAGDFSLIQNVEGSSGLGQFVMMRPNGAVLQGTTDLSGPIITGSPGAISFDAAPSTIKIQANGQIIVTPSNIKISNGFIGLKSFANPDTLERKENQMYSENPKASSIDSDKLLEPGTRGTGFINQNSLEQSNVNLTSEFTKMITSQRNFQVNAKMITTIDEMLKNAINITT